jgi:hypothetical protein
MTKRNEREAVERKKNLEARIYTHSHKQTHSLTLTYARTHVSNPKRIHSNPFCTTSIFHKTFKNLKNPNILLCTFKLFFSKNKNIKE